VSRRDIMFLLQRKRTPEIRLPDTEKEGYEIVTHRTELYCDDSSKRGSHRHRDGDYSGNSKRGWSQVGTEQPIRRGEQSG